MGTLLRAFLSLVHILKFIIIACGNSFKICIRICGLGNGRLYTKGQRVLLGFCVKNEIHSIFWLYSLSKVLVPVAKTQPHFHNVPHLHCWIQLSLFFDKCKFQNRVYVLSYTGKLALSSFSLFFWKLASSLLSYVG